MTTTKYVLVEVNTAVCKRLAELLRKSDIPHDEEESALPGFPHHFIGNFFLALVAICHQTSPRHHPALEGVVESVHLRGWDYLFARFESAARNNAALLEPATWRELAASDIRDLFRDEEYGELLTDTEGRAALLRDLGQRMLAHAWKNADAIQEFCNGRVATGHPNLLDMLAEFRAYDDPVRKKSLFFLALMRNSHTWRYRDDETLGPPVDYHEVRGHLRIGTIDIKSSDLREKLRQGIEVASEEDVAIRQAIYDAIMLLSRDSGMNNPSQLHYLFWNVFRSVCTRQSPQCLKLSSNSTLPQRYLPLTVQQNDQRRCPFWSVCKSARIDDRFVEHVFQTDYY